MDWDKLCQESKEENKFWSLPHAHGKEAGLAGSRVFWAGPELPGLETPGYPAGQRPLVPGF